MGFLHLLSQINKGQKGKGKWQGFPPCSVYNMCQFFSSFYSEIWAYLKVLLCSLRHRSASVIDLEVGPWRKENTIPRTSLHHTPLCLPVASLLTESWNFPLSSVAYASEGSPCDLFFSQSSQIVWRNRQNSGETPSFPKTSPSDPPVNHLLLRVRRTYTYSRLYSAKTLCYWVLPLVFLPDQLEAPSC